MIRRFELSRRTFLQGLCANTLIAHRAAASGQGNAETIDPGARAAALYTFAPWEFSRIAWQVTGQFGGNLLRHSQKLANPTDRVVTTPNNDTIYSTAMLDLSAGPMVLVVPASPERYLSASVHSTFTDVDVLVSGRETRAGPIALTLCGPNWEGEPAAGTRLARMTTNDAWLIARTLVTGAADLPAAAARQAQIALMPLTGAGASAVREWTVAPRAELDPANRLDAVNHLLGRSPLTGQALRAAHFAAYGIIPGREGAFAQLPPNRQAALAAALHSVEAALPAGLLNRSRSVMGWRVPQAGVAEFGDDDAYRAAVARVGLGALPNREAVYFSLRHPAAVGSPVSLRLTIPSDPPCDGFWSLSLYRPEPDGRRFFFENPIGRYALGDRSPGVKQEPDGSIVIDIASAPPRNVSNWLPAPAGTFDLMLRLYLPRAQAFSGDWSPGPLEPV